MIKHIVMFKLKDEAEGCSKEENLAEAVIRAKRLKELIPQIKKMSVVTGAEGSANTNYDLALICDFENMEDLGIYQVHPDHKAYGAFITPRRELRACIDY